MTNSKIKEYATVLSANDIIDVKLFIEQNQVKGFIINYRTKIKDSWYQVFRIDTCHKYLHEQRFWISPEPIPLAKTSSLQYIFNFYLDQIRDNYQRYKRYYIQRMEL